MKKLKLVMAVLFFVTIQSFAGVCISIGSGNWESSSTWSCGNVPVCGDSILIIAGDIVTIRALQDYFTPCSQPMYLTVNGTLAMQTGKKLLLPAQSVVEIKIGGVIEPGNGGGTSNLIDIGGVTVWKAEDGTINGYAIFQIIPLPIELLGFEANPLGDNIEIKWTTLTETNNDYFTVERSRDGTNFESLTQIDGAGNSITVLNYSCSDIHPYQCVSYYRIKQTDFNGTFTYSNLVAVNFENKNLNFLFNIYPNPADGLCIGLEISSEKGEEIPIVGHDFLGKEIFSNVITIKESGANLFTIYPEKKLSPGMYFIKATSMHKEYIKKIIIE